LLEFSDERLSNLMLLFLNITNQFLYLSNLRPRVPLQCMLHKLQEFLKRDTLDFSEITYTLLMDFENYLSDFTRAKSMYLGEIRHLYREAMLEYNTDEETVIKNVV